MKPMLLLASLTAALALTACDKKEEAAPAPAPKAEAPAPKPSLGGVDPAQVKVIAETMEAAMQKIPPELRNDFHKYWECEIKANNARPAADQKKMDGNQVIEMTKALQANRALANCS
jgi:hypothetical protein